MARILSTLSVPVDPEPQALVVACWALTVVDDGGDDAVAFFRVTTAASKSPAASLFVEVLAECVPRRCRPGRSGPCRSRGWSCRECRRKPSHSRPGAEVARDDEQVLQVADLALLELRACAAARRKVEAAVEAEHDGYRHGTQPSRAASVCQGDRLRTARPCRP